MTLAISISINTRMMCHCLKDFDENLSDICLLILKLLMGLQELKSLLDMMCFQVILNFILCVYFPNISYTFIAHTHTYTHVVI